MRLIIAPGLLRTAETLFSTAALAPLMVVLLVSPFIGAEAAIVAALGVIAFAASMAFLFMAIGVVFDALLLTIKVAVTALAGLGRRRQLDR